MFQCPALEDSVYHTVKPREISLRNKETKAGSLEMRSLTREHLCHGKICFQYRAVRSERQIAGRRKIVEIAVALIFLLDFIISILKLLILHFKLNLVNREFMQ